MEYMDAETRRQEIVKYIEMQNEPVSGTKLAKEFHVSRQVIVQDMAVLRAAGYEILSTYRGYICEKKKQSERIFCVNHSDDEIAEELNAIVDFGGTAEDVFISHEVYGTLRAPLNIRSRRQVQRFVVEIENGGSRPLKNITSGIHFHTISAENDSILDDIAEELRKKGFLYENQTEVK